MTPVDSVIDLSYATGTISSVAHSATPIFASTITPAAFFEGVVIGGIVVSAVMAAVWGAVVYIFQGSGQQKQGEMAGMISSPAQLGMKLKRYSTLSNFDVK